MIDAMAVRVLLADDFELVRDGVRITLESDPAITVVGEAEDGRQALERARELLPDVLVLDLRMSDHGGMEALHAITDQLPEVRPLVLTANVDPDSVRVALAAGAAGYVSKRVDGDELCEAVLAVARGELVVSVPEPTPPAAGGAPRPPGPRLVLSRRQRAVVRLLAAGLTDREIAERLFVSVRTVQYDLRDVKNRTGLSRRSEIARWAVIHSLG